MNKEGNEKSMVQTVEKKKIKPVKLPQGKLFIGGKWQEARSGKTFPTINPATEEVITQVAEADEADVNLAVKAARKAFEEGVWPKLSAKERGKLLWKISELLEKYQDELAALETLDNGKPIQDSKSVDIPSTIECFQYYAGWANKIYGETIPVDGSYFNYTLREPVGVVGAIVPWNFPLGLSAGKIAPALACGCTVILKPAEQTPLSALRLAEIMQEAGLPDGVLNVLTGFGPAAGASLVRHPGVDKIAFTGEYVTGQEIMKNAAGTLKRISLELGGKSPHVIFADADLDRAVENAMTGVFFNAGQVCCAGTRIFLEKKIHDAFAEKLVEKTKKLRQGDPFDPKTEIGPQVSSEQLEKVMRYLEIGKKEGARLLVGGNRPSGAGYYVKPTLFDEATNDMRIAREEIFGPVACLIPFQDADEVIQQANDTFYGLAAAVWTRDIEKAHRFAKMVRAGTVWVNCYGAFDQASPFGGYKMSGFGRDGGRNALDLYTEVKSVWVNLSQK